MNILNKLHNPNVGILLIRVALGAVFIAHGWAKFADMEGTIGFFSSLGMAAFLAYFVSAAELVGGILMILGLFVRPVGIILASIMAVAILSVKIKMGFLGGYEYELVLLLIALSMVFLGGGSYKVWKCCGPECKC